MPLVKLLLACACLLAFSGCAAVFPPSERHARTLARIERGAPAGPLLAGAAEVDLTPRDEPVYMAGYKILKTNESIDGEITARAIALARGELRAVVVGCDLIGLHHYQVEEVRRRLRPLVPPSQVLVACTHNHAGPDTLGMWGLPPLMSGLDDAVTERVLSGIVRAAELALGRLEPARVRWGEVEAPLLGVSKNRREPTLIDRRVTCLAFDRPDGSSIATLVHFACHPETLGSSNTILSPDFPGALYATVEARRPGVALFLNGALGGMVTVDRQGGRTLAEAKRIGRAVGELALAALAPGHPLSAELELRCARQPVYVPIELRLFHVGAFFGIFGPRPFVGGGYTPSEVMALRLGPVVLLSLPGEVLPKFGFELDARIASEVGLVVGLGNDELGYLVHESDWEDERYDYERTVSPGKLATGVLRDAAWSALAGVGALKEAE